MKNKNLLLFILTVILCFGFFLTNSSMGIDDEILNWYGSVPSIVSIGRLGRMAQWVIGYEYLPFFYDFIAICLYSLGILLTAHCFMRYIEDFSSKQALIFSCIAASFPFTAFLFIFIVVTVHIGAGILSSAAGTFIFCKYLFDDNRKRYLWLSLLCLIFSISLYETSIIYFLISMLFIIFMKSKPDIKLTAKSLLMTGGCITIYLIILKIIKICLGIRHNRSDEFIKYNFSSFSDFITSFFDELNKLWTNYTQTINHDFGSFVVLLSIVLFCIFTTYLTIKRKSIITLIVGVMIILLPLSTFFITGNGELQYRVYAPFGYFAGFAFSEIFVVCNNKKRPGVYFSYILITMIVLTVLNQAREINRIFYFENLRYKDDLAFARFIMHDLGRKNLNNKPIVMAGKKEEIRLEYNYDVEAPEIMVSLFNWDKYNSPESEFFVSRGYSFMQLHGLNIVPFQEYNHRNIERIIKEIQRMPAYPNEGYIKDMKDFVIVKIGPSVFDKDTL